MDYLLRPEPDPFKPPVAFGKPADLWKFQRRGLQAILKMRKFYLTHIRVVDGASVQRGQRQ